MSVSALYLDQESIARRLISLSDRTGYDIVQKHGQRIYGGPPPGWAGPQPGKGTEVYCYRIPRDCFEDELVPVFSSVGKIFELRLMIEFSGTNRSYCYVRYCTQDEAREAINKLSNHYIRPGYPLAITRSVDNRKLSIKTIPSLDNETEEDVIQELRNVVEGVDRVKFQSCGWVEVEFSTHRLAALARRQLVPGNVVMFDRVAVKQVDWADPEVEKMANDSQGKVICVRNIPYSLTEHEIGEMFNSLSGGQVINVVRVRNTMLVSFVSQEGAMNAMERSRDAQMGGVMLEVNWWSQKRLDRTSYSSQPRFLAHQYTQQQLGGSQEAMGRTGPGIMQEQVDSYSVNRDMALLAQRNMMFSQQASQMSHPPPGYGLSQMTQAFSGLGFAAQSRLHPLYHPLLPQFPPPSSLHPTPPSTRHTAQATQYLLPISKPATAPNPPVSNSQYMQGDTPMFPSISTRPDSPRPVMVVPPVYRGMGNTKQYQ